MRQAKRTVEYYREALLAGDRVALARAITAVENNRADARNVFQAINGHGGNAHVIGITGAPGAGKSTLVNAAIHEFRQRGRKIGVIAIDPTSPFSGGAILGDRIRMSEHGADENVFVRSLAARGHLGGLSRATARVVDVMDAAGCDIVIVETVGTGQSEVEIMEIAQTVLVVCAPGLGDDIQAVKAGILEIADILVVNKADMAGAERTVGQLRDAISLGPKSDWAVPVLKTAATTGEGVPVLVDETERHLSDIDADERRNAALIRMRALIASSAVYYLRKWLDDLQSAEIDELCRDVLSGETDLDEAVLTALRALSEKRTT